MRNGGLSAAMAADITDVALRLVGAFYVFGGVLAARAGLMSQLLDRAIAGISGRRPTRVENAEAAWLLASAILLLAGGAALMLLLDLAFWLFLTSAAGQLAYLTVIAPRWFDVTDPPDPQGRQGSRNAFVIYLAATAFVTWAYYTERLVDWRDAPWPLVSLVAAAVLGFGAWTAWAASRPLASPALAQMDEYDGIIGDADASESVSSDPSQSQRVKVMADYGCHPLWALDPGLYGNIEPSALGLSPELVHDLDAWAKAYDGSLDRENPGESLWTDTDHRVHGAAGRVLAVRLAQERPDLQVYVIEPTIGVVEVHADEPI